MIIGIIGPTASGKSDIGERLIEQNCRIINADSRQVCNYLHKLTFAASPDENHALTSFLNIGEKINVYDWAKLAIAEIDATLAVGKTPIILGGTGLYFKILQEGIVQLPEVPELNLTEPEIVRLLQIHDPASLLKYQDIRRRKRALQIKLATGIPIAEFYKADREKLHQYELCIYGLLPEKQILQQRIKTRLNAQLNDRTLFEEAAEFPGNSDIIGCSEIKSYLNGSINFASMYHAIFLKTTQYAKRQSTYIRNSLHLSANFSCPEQLYSHILYKSNAMLHKMR